MQRAAESDHHQSRTVRSGRIGRTGRIGRPSRARVLVGAAVVPVMLLAVGCSSDSDSGSAPGDDLPAELSEAASESATPEVAEAAYALLPDACEVFSQKTLKSVVPKGVKSGKAINTAEKNVTGDCRWISLDNNGVDGSQYRWLSVSLHLLESNTTNGTGEDRAHDAFGTKVAAAKAVDGAKSVKTETVTGTGDEATVVRYDLKKDGDTFKQQTIVVRTENVVITLDYNGAGLAGDKAPSVDSLMKSAKAAAKEAVEAVGDANDGSDASASASPSKGASKTPSKGATKSSTSGGSGADVSSDSDSDSDSDSADSTSGGSSSKRKSSR